MGGDGDAAAGSPSIQLFALRAKHLLLYVLVCLRGESSSRWSLRWHVGPLVSAVVGERPHKEALWRWVAAKCVLGIFEECSSSCVWKKDAPVQGLCDTMDMCEGDLDVARALLGRHVYSFRTFRVAGMYARRALR